MRAILAILLLSLAGCTSMAHRTSLHLQFSDGSCSGTAIGPHAVLGAEHCFTGAKLLRIDGQTATVRRIIRDHSDHVIVIVAQRFEHWSLRAAMPDQGSEIYIFGNPGVMRDIYRRGYVAGRGKVGKWDCTMLDLRVWSGDSGSAVRNRWGDVVGVVSIMYTMDMGRG